jgi:hypothetical protein
MLFETNIRKYFKKQIIFNYFYNIQINIRLYKMKFNF